jgi:transposase-like protein
VSVTQVAEELDILVGYLLRWRREVHKAQDLASTEARVDPISENAKLKDEIKRVKVELEIIKKAAVYFGVF